MSVNTELIEELYPTTPEKVGVVVNGLLAAGLLASSALSARRGNYSSAIFKAVVWAGYTNNLNHSIRFKLSTLGFQQEKAIARRVGF